MWEVYERITAEMADRIDDQLILDHLQREKGRFKAQATSGAEVRVFLERGHTLLIGEVLRSNCGKNLSVIGAVEEVTIARTDDWGQFSKACYHLGNRHVKLQVGDRWLRIKPDHVLEDMLQQLGLEMRSEQAVFVPEPGAYFKPGSQQHGHQSSPKETSHGHHHH
ncbi:MAG: urease accessory protein UreE [Moraxellaceae bacterium]|nr:MAG: urease accessory protein UreE [Moraxellaceae bacterium]